MKIIRRESLKCYEKDHFVEFVILDDRLVYEDFRQGENNYCCGTYVNSINDKIYQGICNCSDIHTFVYELQKLHKNKIVKIIDYVILDVDNSDHFEANIIMYKDTNYESFFIDDLGIKRVK